MIATARGWKHLRAEQNPAYRLARHYFNVFDSF